jgi:hypothetical protein
MGARAQSVAVTVEVVINKVIAKIAEKIQKSRLNFEKRGAQLRSHNVHRTAAGRSLAFIAE